MAECPCVRDEQPAPPCDSACWHFHPGNNGYCCNCGRGQPTETLYRIKPLPWQCVRPAGHQDGEWWSAETVFGTVNVEQDYYEGEGYGSYHWRYCVDEFYDEGRHDCDSIDAGKTAAEEWFRGRLMPALLPSPAPAGEGVGDG